MNDLLPAVPSAPALAASPKPPGVPAPKRIGRPSTITEENRGKLVIALAAGISRREAAAWIDRSHTSIGYYIRHDPEFAQQLSHYLEMVRLHPYLGMYRAVRDSWQGCVAMIHEWERRHGTLTSDRLLLALKQTVEKVLDSRE